MVIQLDPRIPLVWRTPQCLQFGVDQPCIVLEHVSPAEERIIAALLAGAGQSAIDMIAQSLDFGADDLARLLESLTPALVRKRTRAAWNVSISGSGQSVAAITDVLARSGVSLSADDTGTEPPAALQLAIIVAHFVVDPELHRRWLSRDLPHLAIVLGDRVVRIGPLIIPGQTACLICLELHARDADTAHAALSSQLWGRMSAVETALVVAEVAASSSRLVMNHLNTPRSERVSTSTSTSIELDVTTGTREERIHLPHPECGCLTMDPARDAVRARPPGVRGPRAVSRS